MLFQLFILLLGFFLLIKGASSLAKLYRISDLAVGLTVVAFGTSAPELFVNTVASLQDHHEIVFSNVIGSNIFNILVILGIAGLITSLKVQSSTVWKEIPISLVAVIVLYFMVNFFSSGSPNELSRLEGLMLLVLFSGFLFYVYVQLKTETEPSQNKTQQLSLYKICILILLGLLSLIIGGQLVINGAVGIASALSVSEKIIGLTIVAAGTSLPELATTAVAAKRNKADIAVGNIVGSNIFNICLILGVSSLIKPIKYNPSLNIELFFLGAVTIFLFIGMFTGQKKKLDRWEAVLLLLFFSVYMTYLLLPAF